MGFFTNNLISASNFLPGFDRDRFKVRSKQFNALVEKIATLLVVDSINDIQQQTSATTAVDMAGRSALISTVSLTTAAGTSFEFDINNPLFDGTNLIVIDSILCPGDGQVTATVANQGAGSFTLRVTNVHGTDALNDSISLFVKVIPLTGSLA